ARGADARRPGQRPARGARNPLPRGTGRPGAAVRLDRVLPRVLARPFRQARRPAQEDGPMTDAQTHTQKNAHAQTRSVVMERDLPHKPEKVWRAITTPALIEDWLMKTDFTSEVGRKFTLRMEPQQGWDGVIHCELLAFEPTSHLRYGWSSLGLDTVVDFTLTPTATGTHLRMEQSG